MGNAHLTISTFPFFISFKNACWKLVACLEASYPSPAKMDMKFPGSCDDWVQHLPHRTWQRCQGPRPTTRSTNAGARGFGLGRNELLAEGVDRYWGSRNLSVFTLLVHVESNFWEKDWFLCSFLLDIRGTILDADPAPSALWPLGYCMSSW